MPGLADILAPLTGGSDPLLPGKRGTILPVGRDADDGVVLAWPQAALDAWDAIQLPRQVLAGEEEPSVENGLNFALTVGLGGAGASRALVPEGAADLGMFVGRRARGVDHEALFRAEQMAWDGAPRSDILAETGWFPGPGGRMRTEIADRPARVNPALPDLLADPNARFKLGNVVHHPELFQAYPEFARMEVVPSSNPGFYGRYSRPIGRPEGLIELNPTAGGGLDAVGLRGTILHELQHAVQGVEGFPAGGSPDGVMYWADPGSPWYIPEVGDAYQQALARSLGDKGQAAWEVYRRLAGEVESRTVEARQFRRPEELTARPPWEDWKYPLSDQVVVEPWRR